MKPAEFFEAIQSDANPDLGPVFLNAPLANDELTRWQQQNPRFKLPDDLVGLYKLHNGFRIYAEGDPDNWDRDDGFPILFPLRRFQYAARTMYLDNTELDDGVPDTWLALSTDQDGSQYIILDTATGRYYDMDPVDPTPVGVATDVAELLDWIYDRYIVNA